MGGSYFYLVGTQFKSSNYGALEEEKQVGSISEIQGVVRIIRKRGTTPEIAQTGVRVSVGNTIYSEKESSALLKLDTGEELKLKSSSMIEIQLEERDHFSSIFRQEKAALTLLAGQVEGTAKNTSITIKTDRGEKIELGKVQVVQSKRTLEEMGIGSTAEKPTSSTPQTQTQETASSPAPIVGKPSGEKPEIEKVEIVSPPAGTVATTGADKAASLKFQWRVTPRGSDVLFLIRRTDRPPNPDKPDDAKPAFQKVISSTQDISEVSVKLKTAGKYEWEIRRTNDRPIPGSQARRAFVVENIEEKIVFLEATINGVKASEFVQNKTPQDSISIFWNKPQSARNCLVEVWKNPNIQQPPVLRAATRENKFTFQRAKVQSPRAFYRVTCATDTAKKIQSAPETLVLNFQPPALQLHTRKFTAAESATGIQFNWKAASFAEKYEIQVARDPDSRTAVHQSEVHGTSIQLKNLAIGKYFWRVRAGSGIQKSVFSKPAAFEVIQ